MTSKWSRAEIENSSSSSSTSCRSDDAEEEALTLLELLHTFEESWDLELENESTPVLALEEKLAGLATALVKALQDHTTKLSAAARSVLTKMPLSGLIPSESDSGQEEENEEQPSDEDCGPRLKKH